MRPYQNIRSLVYISRKYAANLQHICGLYLRRVCRKHVFCMQITFLAHCSGTQCAPQVCSTQLSRTVLAHNVRRKFAAHSCRTLYWHTMCAESMQCTVVAHYSGTQCAPQVCGAQLPCTALFCPPPPTPTPNPTPPIPTPPHPNPWFITSTAIFFLVPYPQGECEKNVGMVGKLQKIKILGWGWEKM